MQGNRAALRYAKAIFEMAREKNLAKEVNEDMSLIKKTIEENNELRVFLKSPVIKDSMKGNALKEIFTNVNELTKGLFGILIENKRIDILTLVAGRYKDLFNQMNKVQVARVTTAVPLTPVLEEKIQAKVKELTGNEASIQNIVDESIIGGFILRVGDIQYNGSVTAQLNGLKRQFKNNTYVSKI